MKMAGRISGYAKRVGTIMTARNINVPGFIDVPIYNFWKV
jgi:hypothetical protein